MYWNVHVDALEHVHDLIVEREGVFKECIEAIKMAKILGYQVATNTTVYNGITQIETTIGGKFRTPFSINVIPTVSLYDVSQRVTQYIDVPLSVIQTNLTGILANQTVTIQTGRTAAGPIP